MNDLPKYVRVAASVRAQIDDGDLRPGQSAPSGAELARQSGYSVLTCRKALRALIKDGVLVAGSSPNARPRVPTPASTPEEQTRADVARALSSSLATRRRAFGLIQPELAALVGVSITTIGHAETGRLWQSREFWERADKILNAGGGFLRLYEAYRRAIMPLDPTATADLPNTRPTSAGVTCITINWADGTVTTIHPVPGTDAKQSPNGDAPEL